MLGITMPGITMGRARRRSTFLGRAAGPFAAISARRRDGAGRGRIGVSVVLLGAAAALLLFGSTPSFAGAAAGLGSASVQAGPATSLRHRVWFHRRREMQLYCLKRNYWWFYRPYKMADKNHARCMPYFHYLQESRSASTRTATRPLK